MEPASTAVTATQSFDKSPDCPSLLPVAALDAAPLPMTAREDKLAPSTWILWIMALAVCLGWNAFAPDPLDAAKEDPGKGIGLAHQSDDLPAPVVQPHSLTGLLPVACGFSGFQGGPARRLGIEVSRERPMEGVRGGGIQGRAPPLEA